MAYSYDWKKYAPSSDVSSDGMDDFQADEGDDFIEEGNHGGLLEKIVSSARGPMGLASSPLGMLPTSGQEALDIGRVGLGNTVGMVNPFGSSISPMSIGASLADNKSSVIGVPQIEEAMKPQTEYGQGLDLSAKGAMLASPFAMNPALGGQMLGSAKKGLGGMFDLAGAKRGLSGAVRKGSLSAEGSLSKMMQGASDEMGAGLQAIDDTGVTDSQLKVVLNRVASVLDEQGTSFGNPESAAGRVLALKDRISQSRTNFTGPQLQAKYMELKDALGKIGPAGSKAQWALGEHFKEILPDSMKGIREAMSGAYKKGNLAKPLTKRGTLNQIAKGTMDDELLAELKEASKQVPGLEGLIAQITGAGKKVRTVKATRTAGKYAAGAGLGIPLLQKLMRGLGGASNVTNIYQGGE